MAGVPNVHGALCINLLIARIQVADFVLAPNRPDAKRNGKVLLAVRSRPSSYRNLGRTCST